MLNGFRTTQCCDVGISSVAVSGVCWHITWHDVSVWASVNISTSPEGDHWPVKAPVDLVLNGEILRSIKKQGHATNIAWKDDPKLFGLQFFLYCFVQLKVLALEQIQHFSLKWEEKTHQGALKINPLFGREVLVGSWPEVEKAEKVLCMQHCVESCWTSSNVYSECSKRPELSTLLDHTW